ncbi:cellulase family glycosylhydrolase [Flagellimonas hadalis]|uniref:Cellulase family glycosylhydrolase n=1 Tax=Flagellimonas hadalis TaxID=2597517 RepID=A0A5N5ISE9_9FLAO|nr:cellulase family glycosylhydrolase [Allomuricauda hadalis]KAB5487646.1 cellulase family glycosylhydrolase [Allomuricauda hadalis]
MKKSIYFLFILINSTVFGQGFLHTDGQKIVDAQGNNVLLRGLGLGGWMVQEGYMLQTASFAGPQHVIKQKITELIGEENTEAFYEAYMANGITKRDIDSLKAWGFNSVRLPMHYNLYTPPIEEEKNGEITWLEKGFAMTDDLLEWCAENEMYLILDLHAAPGGQGHDANISDYDATKPSLWESEANKQKMIAFWEKMAERYKDHPWMGGYDIVNEPNWNFEGENPNGCDEKNNAPLRQLMVDITTAIRKIDTNHIIYIEGNCWGNNYNGIFPLWDDNMVISFHKYWNFNTTESIQQVLDYREKYNAPIWLGESGENSNVWFKDALTLMESHNIGWAFWPMKKVDNIAGVTSVTKTPEYETLLDYWQNGGEKPTIAFAQKTLMQLAENYKMENVTVKPDVVDAMFRQVQTFETKAYKRHSIPGLIYATDYDMGTQNYAYSDVDYINYRVSTGEQGAWNKGRKMRNDGVDIQSCSDSKNNGYEVFDIQDGEWLLFTVSIEKSGTYAMDVRYSSMEGTGKLHLKIDGSTTSKSVVLPATEGATSYKTATLSGIDLKEGTHKIKVAFEKGGFNLNYLEFKMQ